MYKIVKSCHHAELYPYRSQKQTRASLRAAVEPILLTKQSRPSHVLMSAESYQQLIDRLAELEDMLLGHAAKEALNQSQMVGSETFVQTLQELANGET